MSGELEKPWPDGRVGAVSLTFDDGLSSQLELAAPILLEHGLRATFYVCPRGDDWQERLAPWRGIAAAGHEVGNHTVDHICSHNFGWAGRRGLEECTLDDLTWQVSEGKRRLQELIPEQAEMTFCYPCYQAFIGVGESRRSYVPVVARHHPAGRGRGEAANHPRGADLHYLWSWPAEGMRGPQIVGLIEQAARQGRWAILTFHGIQQGGLAITAEALRETAEHLREHADRLWTAPVLEVAERLQQWLPNNPSASSRRSRGRRAAAGRITTVARRTSEQFLLI